MTERHVTTSARPQARRAVPKAVWCSSPNDFATGGAQSSTVTSILALRDVRIRCSAVSSPRDADDATAGTAAR